MGGIRRRGCDAQAPHLDKIRRLYRNVKVHEMALVQGVNVLTRKLSCHIKKSVRRAKTSVTVCV
jgi:hypothetical protein